MNADFVIRPFAGRADFEASVELQENTWGRGFSERVPVAILQSVQRLGGVASGAFDTGGRLVGFIFGITGWRDGRPIHWSDMLAVSPGARDRGIGEALKRHQRNVLLDRGIRHAEWTFDPLEARNAHLNFNRLGAVAGQYVRDFYGESDSTLHAGLSTDRLMVSWHLDSERVRRRLDGLDPLPGPEDTSDAPVVNPIHTEAGMPVCDGARTDLVAGRIRVAIPADFQSVRAASPDIASVWRRVTRDAFEAYLPRGYVVTAVVRYGRWSAFLLDRPAS